MSAATSADRQVIAERHVIAERQLRLERLNDELDRYAPTAFGGSVPVADHQVLMQLYETFPRRNPCTPYHVDAGGAATQTFKVTPGWFEFREVTFNNGGGTAAVPLRLMEPQAWAPGTLLYLECAIRWAVSSGRVDGSDIVFKDGAYTIRRAEVKAYTEAPILAEGPNDAAASAAEIDRDFIRRFPLGTIGVASVTPIFSALAMPAVSSNPFDIALVGTF